MNGTHARAHRCVRLCIPCKPRVALTKGQKPPPADALLATPMVDLATNRAKSVESKRGKSRMGDDDAGAGAPWRVGNRTECPTSDARVSLPANPDAWAVDHKLQSVY